MLILKTFVECGKSKIGITTTSIQVRKLFKGRNYLSLEGFNCANYTREETIQGWKLFSEYNMSRIVYVIG
jgi:hypothetical protein